MEDPALSNASLPANKPRRIAQLMSRGHVQTLAATARLDELARRLRRVGHPCWPVLSDGQLVGLLHQRDLERALEHGLGALCAQDIMQTRAISLHAHDTLHALESTLAQHGRGAVAVLGDAGELLGMVSRGDLLRHRVASRADIRQMTLGDGPQTRLIRRIAEEARRAEIALWLVGGTVRDLLLRRPCDDIDFLVERSPQRFATRLQQRLGGRLNPPTPFGTIRWFPDEQRAARPASPSRPHPTHIDFAAARAETYAQPAALPSVYRSTLRQDLGRRDFSINALAVQLAPHQSPVIDLYAGLADLDAGQIRVLHSLSFHDDPLRILRAWRFRSRFGFNIEPRTRRLMRIARPALGRISGARLRNELELLLQETDPGGILLAMQDDGLLEAMHPAFRVSPALPDSFRPVQDAPAQLSPPPTLTRLWHALAAEIPPDALPAFCERLGFPPKMTRSLRSASRTLREPGALADPRALTLHVVECLRAIPPDAAWCVWRLTDSPLARERIADFRARWSQTRARSDGHTLRAAGLPSGPRLWPHPLAPARRLVRWRNLQRRGRSCPAAATARRGVAACRGKRCRATRLNADLVRQEPGCAVSRRSCPAHERPPRPTSSCIEPARLPCAGRVDGSVPMESQLTIWLAFIAGLVSFVSPCVLPLVPAYIGYMGGRMTSTLGLASASGGQVALAGAGQRLLTFAHSLFFVAGFSLVFVGIGLLSTAFISVIGGQNISVLTDLIGRIGGLVIIIFGLHFSGLLPGWLLRLRDRAALLANPLFSLAVALLGAALILWGFSGDVLIQRSDLWRWAPWAPAPRFARLRRLPLLAHPGPRLHRRRPLLAREHRPPQRPALCGHPARAAPDCRQSGPSPAPR